MQFIVTFTQRDARRNCFTIVESELDDPVLAEREARAKTFDTYGSASWSGFYNSENDAGVEKFNLTKIPFGD